MASMLPSAKELVERAAQNEAEKAAEAMRLQGQGRCRETGSDIACEHRF